MRWKAFGRTSKVKPLGSKELGSSCFVAPVVGHCAGCAQENDAVELEEAPVEPSSSFRSRKSEETSQPGTQTLKRISKTTGW